MTFHPQRYSQVPWIAQSDLDEGQKVVWEYEQGSEKIQCWPCPLYAQKATQTGYMILHAVKGNGNDGGVITLALSDVPHFDWYAQFSMGLQVSVKRR